MYSKQEISKLRQEFWTVFGKYMAPVNSAEGEKVNWINYKTNFKGVVFKMEAGNGNAEIGIAFNGDYDLQQFYFNQLFTAKKILEKETGEEWIWQKPIEGSGIDIHYKIYTRVEGLTIFNKNDWPGLISFFKSRIIALDKFWTDVKDFMETGR